MSAVAPTPTLRDAHRDLTRGRILSAIVALMRDKPFESVTNSEIAASAGVTERTLYRHFPTRDALEAAIWEFFTEQHLNRRGFPKSAEELATLSGVLFEGFDAEEGLARWFVSSKKGQEIRLRVNEERKRAYLACVKEARPDLDDAALVRVAAVCQLLDGSFAWQSLKDYWGLSSPESGRAVSEAISVLLGLDAARPAQKKSTRRKEISP